MVRAELTERLRLTVAMVADIAMDLGRFTDEQCLVAADAILALLDTATAWTPVGEAMPTEPQPVWVTIVCAGIPLVEEAVAQWIDDVGAAIEFVTPDRHSLPCRVTHWMPRRVPDPPKEG